MRTAMELSRTILTLLGAVFIACLLANWLFSPAVEMATPRELLKL